jgi:hypothetical protein
MDNPTQILRVSTSASVRWRINRTSPVFFDAKLGGYTLINPIFTDPPDVPAGSGNFPAKGLVILLSKDEVVFSSHDIGLVIPSDTKDDVLSEEIFSKIAAEVDAFLMWIRFLSFQDPVPLISGSDSIIAVSPRGAASDR